MDLIHDAVGRHNPRSAWENKGCPAGGMIMPYTETQSRS